MAVKARQARHHVKSEQARQEQARFVADILLAQAAPNARRLGMATYRMAVGKSTFLANSAAHSRSNRVGLRYNRFNDDQNTSPRSLKWDISFR